LWTPKEPPVFEGVPPYQARSAIERWGPGLLIVVAVWAAYIPTFNNQFVSWDDDHYIYDNQQVILLDGIKSVWATSFTTRARLSRRSR